MYFAPFRPLHFEQRTCRFLGTVFPPFEIVPSQGPVRPKAPPHQHLRRSRRLDPHFYTIPRVSFFTIQNRNPQTPASNGKGALGSRLQARKNNSFFRSKCCRPVKYRTYSAEIPCQRAATSRIIAHQAFIFYHKTIGIASFFGIFFSFFLLSFCRNFSDICARFCAF